MQQAYTSEKGDGIIGSWYYIGYSGPGEWTTKPTDKAAAASASTNFTYTEGTTTSEDVKDQVGFKASNKTKLNECDKGDNWTITLSKDTGIPGHVRFTAATKCPDLTPTFENVGNPAKAGSGNED